MFDLLDRPLHWIPVTWPALVPGKKDSDLSEQGEYEIELRVELVDREEAKTLFPNLFAKEGEEKDNPPDGFDVFKRVVKEWRKIKANGRAVPLTDENIRALLRAPMFEAAFAVAYVSALGGQHMVREGNSAASPSGGRGDTEKAARTVSKKTASASA